MWVRPGIRLALARFRLVRERALGKGAGPTGRRKRMVADEGEKAVRAHRSSYNLFIALMKYGAIISIVTALIVILIIRN